MVRDIYRQSVGNPLQIDRLRSSRPDIQLPFHPYTPAQDAKFTLKLLFLFSLLGAAAMLSQALHLESRFAPVHRPLTWTNIVLVTVAAWLIGKSIKERSGHWLKLPLGCLVATFIYFNLPLPGTIQFIATSVGVGVFTWLLAVHWTYQCTTTPCGGSTVASLRASWKGYLLLMACVPSAWVFLMVSVPQLFSILVLLAIPCFQIAESFRRRARPCHNAWNALVSWMTYNRHDASTPGIFQSPAGSWKSRMILTGTLVVLVATTYVRWPVESIGSAIGRNGPPPAVASALSSMPKKLSESNTAFWDRFVVGTAVMVALILLPTAVTFTTPIILSLPVLGEAGKYHKRDVDADNWKHLVRQIQQSVDPVERASLFMGRVAHDGSPLLVPRQLFHEHAHFLGDSGSGKTSLGLAPLIEQIISQGDCSVVVIDLKADSMELLGTLNAAAEAGRKKTKQPIPLKHFSNQVGRTTFAFNPLLQPFWRQLELYMRTDIQCGALGLTYGADYGEGYYSSANAAVLYHTIKTFPDVVTYGELAKRVGYVVANAKKSELHPEIRKAGVHVQTVLDRLGSFEALNVTPGGRYPNIVTDNAIDFTKVFTEPQVHYFHLSSTLSPGSSPEIARLVTYSLLAAATQVRRRHQVFLVIDEFQRMVARNIEYMLQLARSMGVGVILANQTMQDLRTRTADLIPPIESNCRYRQWFAVSSAEDRNRLIQGSGETVEMSLSRSYRGGDGWGNNESISFSERVVPRLSVNDILLATDHPRQSIVRISRGDGYAQYGGMPVIVESNYHITEEDYETRKSTAWPTNVPGCFVPGSKFKPPRPTPPPGPVITDEVIGSSNSSPDQAADPFSSFFQAIPDPRSQTGNRRKSP